MLTARTLMKAPEASRSGATRAAAPSQTARHDDVRAIPAIREAIYASKASTARCLV
jgi:hypothetical protein